MMFGASDDGPHAAKPQEFGDRGQLKYEKYQQILHGRKG
jgi:hypothetical protein